MGPAGLESRVGDQALCLFSSPLYHFKPREETVQNRKDVPGRCGGNATEGVESEIRATERMRLWNAAFMREMGKKLRWGLRTECRCSGCYLDKALRHSGQRAGRGGVSRAGKEHGATGTKPNSGRSRIWPGFRRSHLETDRNAKCRMF